MTGVDINPEMIRTAKKLNKRFKTNVKFINKDITNFYKTSNFNYILMFYNFIEHLPKKELFKLIKRIKKLNRTCLLILNFINLDYSLKTTMFESFNSIINFFKNLSNKKIKRIHEYYYLNEKDKYITPQIKDLIISLFKFNIKNLKLFFKNSNKSFKTSREVSIASKNRNNYIYLFFYSKNNFENLLKRLNIINYKCYLETDFYNKMKFLRFIYNNIRIRRCYVIYL